MGTLDLPQIIQSLIGWRGYVHPPRLLDSIPEPHMIETTENMVRKIKSDKLSLSNLNGR